MAGEHSIGVVEDLGTWMRQMERRMLIQERRPTGESFVGGSYVDELEDHNPYTSTLDEVLGITATNVTDVMVESPLVQALVVNTWLLNAHTIVADEAFIDALTGNLFQTDADPTTGVKFAADFPGSPGGGIIGYDTGGDESFRVDAATGLMSARDVTIDGVFRTSREGPRVEIWDAYYAPLAQTWAMVNFWLGIDDWAPAQILALSQTTDGTDYGVIQIAAPAPLGDEDESAKLLLATAGATDRRATLIADRLDFVAETFYLGSADSTSIDMHLVGTSQYQLFSDFFDPTGWLNFSLGGTRHVIGAKDAFGGETRDLRLKAADIQFEDSVGVLTVAQIRSRLEALEAP